MDKSDILKNLLAVLLNPEYRQWPLHLDGHL